MNAPPPIHRPNGLLFGVAYYPEYHQSERLHTDLDLMKAAKINVIRVGESVWSTWEPREGEFDLEWLSPVLDAAHERDIKVILGTPTYAVPPWLQTAYPEIAAERKAGEQVPWGARQEVDYTHSAFRFHAERVIRAVVGRHARHPAIIGFQVDNEPGLEIFHNHGVFIRFLRWLKAQYGDVETLNREWGLTYWSHRIGDWSELWRPEGNTFPQYDLAWRRFQAELTNDFIAWQASLVREYSSADQFVTTCLQYPRRALDDQQLFSSLNIGAGNPYYGMQDHLDAGKELEQPNYWTTTGVAGLFRQADRMYSSKQARYLVTETNAQSIGTADQNFPPYPGQLKQSAYALISRGAAMIEYWHWHTLPYGTETYWGGVLPHSLKPGRIYAEVAEIGEELHQIGHALDGYVPDADVAILWSNPSRYAMQYMPPLHHDGEPDDESYERIVDAFHGGVIGAGGQARILHVTQAHGIGAVGLARSFPVLVAAGIYIATDDDLKLLQDYVKYGGHLIVGPRTAYADEEARARVATAPDQINAVAGTWYEEYSNLDAPVRVVGSTDGLKLDETSAAEAWIDGLIPEGSSVLAQYDHPRFGDFPAVTTRSEGTGRVTMVGCVPSSALARGIFEWVVPTPAATALAGDIRTPLYVSSGRTADGGRRTWFVFNWGWDKQEITLAVPVLDPASGTTYEAGTKLSLDAWSTSTFVSR